MVPKKEVISLKEEDIKRAIIKVLGQKTWQARQNGRAVMEQIHQNPKHKKPKYRSRLSDLNDEL